MYKLSLRVLPLAENTKERTPLLEAAKPELRKIADKTGEIVHLMIEEHGWGVHVHSVSGESAVPLDTYVGKRLHLHQTGRGKAILAFSPQERREQIIENRGLPAANENTITDIEALETELEKTRERGYAIDKGERIQGLGCVAAPITNTGDRAMGAISIAGPITRLDQQYLNEELAPIVCNQAEVIGFNLNFS